MISSEPPLELFLRKLELNVQLAGDDRRAVLALPHRTRMVEAQTYLTREGDLPTVCGVLGSGFAYRQKLTGDGVRQIVALHIPGDAVDLQHLFLDVADHSVQMLTRGQVAFVPRKDLQDLLDARPAVRHAVLISVLIEGSIFREWVLNVGRRDARTRLAHLLCEFAIRMEAQGMIDGGGFDLPITQEQLADAVGLTPALTMSRFRRRMAQPDMTVCSSFRWIEIRHRYRADKRAWKIDPAQEPAKASTVLTQFEGRVTGCRRTISRSESP